MAKPPISLNRSDFQEVAIAQATFTAGDAPSHPHFRSLVGRRFSRLTVVLYAGRMNKRQRHAYFCLCDCGAKVLALGEAITTEAIRSCGCLLADKNRELRLVHGRSHSDEWNIWQGLKNRCGNRNVRSFEDYGERGITVCARWIEGENGLLPFECFLADMGPRPSKLHTIERRDNDGPYDPLNCLWLPRAEQPRNTRKTPRITYKGRTLSNWEWAAETGISAVQIAKRIGRGWTAERALTQPEKRQPKRCS